MRAARIALFLLGLLLITACSAMPDDDLTIAYGQAARRVGLFPVYPPREEFQIGDVYMWSQSATEPNDTVSVYMTSIGWLRGDADRFLGSRIVFENTTASGAENSLIQTDIPSGGRGIATRSEVSDTLARSLPIASFPSVTADSGFTAGLGLVEALYALGLAGGARTKVTLNFNDVRTYWIPNTEVRMRVYQEIGPIMAQFRQSAVVDRDRLVRLRHGNSVKACGAGRICGVSVVTRVYLTRRIDYTYRNARIVAAALKSAESGHRASVVPNAPAVTVNVQTSSDGSIDGAAIDAQIAALRTQIDTLTNNSNPGASFRFEAWDARGVTFSSNYQRPVVVGWDGIEFQDKQD